MNERTNEVAACEVPLTELLRKVPIDARYAEEYYAPLYGTKWYPVGSYCRRAADEIDDLRILLGRAVDVMTALHSAIEPMDDEEEVPGRVPPAAMRAFADAHAKLLYERARLRIQGSAEKPK